MTTEKLQIHSENILPIIKKWLYHAKDIFVRELISNSTDAIKKREIIASQGETTLTEPFKISVTVNKEEQTLTFSDNGIGMTEEEVRKYIAQIAFSSAEEFVDRYKSEKDTFIGHFGLGFFSAYMVASRVKISTLSYKEGATPVFWLCDGSSDYLLEKGDKEAVGTEITLYLNEDSLEFLEKATIKGVMERFCAFLPYPLYLIEDGVEEKINSHFPLWVKTPKECTDEEYLAFYRYLYPFEEDPLFWVHLNVDYPFHLKGILYFPKIKRDFNPEKSTVKLYCNRVFVADSCKDVIPNFLMALKGVIDSPDIPLNVSRSALQMDKTVRQLGAHITKKVADSLNQFYQGEKEKFFNVYEDLSWVIKLGTLEDEKFYERVKDILFWQNSKDQWVTVPELVDKKDSSKERKIFYAQDKDSHSNLVDLYVEKGEDVLISKTPLDVYVMQFLERKIENFSFQRVDGGIHEDLVEKSTEEHALQSKELADFIQKKLNKKEVTVEAKSLSKESFTGFLVIDEKERRFKEYLMTMQQGNSDMWKEHPVKKTFVVNTNNPLFPLLQKLDIKNPELAEDFVQEIYSLSLLSQKEMDGGSLKDFITLTEKLVIRSLEEITK